MRKISSCRPTCCGPTAAPGLFSFLWWGNRPRSLAGATEVSSSCHQQGSSIKQTSAANCFLSFVIADQCVLSLLSFHLAGFRPLFFLQISEFLRLPQVLNYHHYYSQAAHRSILLFPSLSDVLHALTADVMASLNLSTNGPSIKSSYQGVVNGQLAKSDSPTYALWVLFTVQAPLMNAFQGGGASESVLKVETKGGELRPPLPAL